MARMWVDADKYCELVNKNKDFEQNQAQNYWFKQHQIAAGRVKDLLIQNDNLRSANKILKKELEGA